VHQRLDIAFEFNSPHVRNVATGRFRAGKHSLLQRQHNQVALRQLVELLAAIMQMQSQFRLGVFMVGKGRVAFSSTPAKGHRQAYETINQQR
jgi:hypothetical protein